MNTQTTGIVDTFGVGAVVSCPAVATYSPSFYRHLCRVGVISSLGDSIRDPAGVDESCGSED
jgi:hypothetical protein